MHSWTFRLCTESVQLDDGPFLPKGVNVGIPFWFLQHDEAKYDEPMAFRPDRWLSASTSSEPFAWLAFGGGPRGCIGVRFAMMEARLAIARLVRRFQLDACDRTDRPTLQCRSRGLLIYHANGVWLSVSER